MKRIFLPAIFLMSITVLSQNVKAQDQDAGQDDTQESITLKKNGTFPEDMTIHIHGDEITINGKTPDDIEVIRQKSSADDSGDQSMRQSRGRSGRGFFDGRPSGGKMALLGVLASQDPTTKGAKIEDVEEGTPADSAGLKKGDIITKVDNQIINSPVDLSNAVQNHKPGDRITITYQTGKVQNTASIVLGAIKNGGRLGHNGFGQGQGQDDLWGNLPFSDRNGMQQWFDQMHPRLDRNPNLRMFGQSGPKLGAVVEQNSDPDGARIISVSPDSPAEKAGLKKGDIILSFGDQEIDEITDLRSAISDNQGKKKVDIRVQRGSKEITLKASLEGEKEQADL